MQNILFIHSDQHRYDCIGANGNAVINTPHLDALAESGARFTQAFTPCPVCTPARACLLTGQHTFKHLSVCIPNDTEVPRSLRRSDPLFSELLNSSGYHLDYIGKWHLGEDPQLDAPPTPKECGFHKYKPESNYWQWRKEQGLPLQEYDKKKHSSLGEKYLGGIDEGIPEECTRAYYTANQVIESLSESSRRNKPFFIRWDPSEPHLPNYVPESFASLYNAAQIVPWGSVHDNLQEKPFIQSQQVRSWGTTEWTWDSNWSEYVALYFAHISLLDSAIGKVMCALNELGLSENTIVIYTSDHGDLCGSHGMLDKHYCMYDDILHVPLFIRWPGITHPGQTIRQPVCHELDLAATFSNIATGNVPSYMQGHSLTKLLKGEDWPREHIISTYHGSQFGLYTSRSIRSANWKYIWNLTDIDELYDLNSDPWELTNLASKKFHEAKLTSMRMQLANELDTLDDPIFNQFTKAQLLGNAKPTEELNEG